MSVGVVGWVVGAAWETAVVGVTAVSVQLERRKVQLNTKEAASNFRQIITYPNQNPSVAVQKQDRYA